MHILFKSKFLGTFVIFILVLAVFAIKFLQNQDIVYYYKKGWKGTNIVDKILLFDALL